MGNTFGKALIELREEKSLSQRKLAELSHLTNSTISRLEAGSVSPDLQTISKITEALEIDELQLITKAGIVNMREELIELNRIIRQYSEHDQKEICEMLNKSIASIISELGLSHK